MIKPSGRFPMVTQEARSPPTIKEEAATRPQKNALPMEATMRVCQPEFKRKPEG